MAKLNQIIAVVSTKKADGKTTITEFYHKLKKPELFTGLIRTYDNIDVNGEPLPQEQKLIQLTVNDAINIFIEAMTPVFDTTLTQDTANTIAKADVVVDEVTILKDVPVTHLLFLEKQLTDLQTFISYFPVLDPSQTWNFSNDSNCFVTNESWKYHTKKVSHPLVKYEATDKHPAQVDMVTEDINIGKWKTINQSGAIPAKTQHEYTIKVKKLIEAIKKAREDANSIQVEDKTEGHKIFKFIFGK
jgi:hypothetical protein